VAAQSYLEILREHAASYMNERNGGRVTYEHLFSLAETIKHDLPPGGPLRPEAGDYVARISHLSEALWKALADCPWSGTRCDQLASLAAHSQVFIESVVRHKLGEKRKPIGFGALHDLLSHTELFEHLDIVTLNHDLLLEAVLKNEDCCDGFTDRDGEVRFYDDRAFEGRYRINILKPHGAINWYLFRKGSGHDRHGIPDQGISSWHAKQSNGVWFENLNGNPVFLTGVNKSRRYGTGFFGMQISWFRRFLDQTKRIICSGYGWRDDGMNDLLFQWLDSASDHRLVLLHDGKRIESDLLQDPRCPWSYRHRELVSSGNLKVIPKWLCDCKDASEIINELG
jgi:hypothetical protein